MYTNLKEYSVFIESSCFENYGGWVLDTQYIQNMGSAYLLAHGIGEKVSPATTKITFPKTGKYKLWVYTKNWVAFWKKDYAPGIFSVSIGDKTLSTTFGTGDAEWYWQEGETFEVENLNDTITVTDLTGYEGRFACMFFTMDMDFVPPCEKHELETFRRTLTNKTTVKDGGNYDLVVVGGGYGGMLSAKMASNKGLKVALVQDRPILGGNNSSEVRVWLYGLTCFKEFPKLGELTNIFDQKVSQIDGVKNAASNYEDERKLKIFTEDENITLFLNHSLKQVDSANGKINSITVYNVHTCDYVKLTAPIYADCTGDGTLGYLSGADYEQTNTGHMEQSNFWCVDDMGEEQTFAPCPWAIDLHNVNFVSRPTFNGVEYYTEKESARTIGNWQWGSGFEINPIANDEQIRDYNFRAMYGAWDAIKNTDKTLKNYKIVHSSYISGKRESRRLLGDIVMNSSDIVTGKKYDDAIVGIDFSLDMHRPHHKYYPAYHEGYAFIGLDCAEKFKAPYFMPYRCLYSRNISNLFMAGRDISVTHDALGPVRVMRTIGMMGEVVGFASYLCKKYTTTPRGVYENYIGELLTYMKGDEVQLKNVEIYTDGACSGNPGNGGWAAILSYNGAEKEISGGEKDTTNNRMELLAVINGLKALNTKCNVKIYSDSAYCVNAFLEDWITGWVLANWKTSGNKPVKNVDLWIELNDLTKKHNVEFIKVKGHADNEKNNRCDFLARQEILKLN